MALEKGELNYFTGAVSQIPLRDSLKARLTEHHETAMPKPHAAKRTRGDAELTRSENGEEVSWRDEGARTRQVSWRERQAVPTDIPFKRGGERNGTHNGPHCWHVSVPMLSGSGQWAACTRIQLRSELTAACAVSRGARVEPFPHPIERARV
ncbi:hypothetical protein AAFF_G00337410 [Aldrovandia affinis]|uniref:Uncharacterized protein n=1 Tax=Aldrovandia affinis TaxID=143900 RepID=A0AAD7WQB9_9TELE|nr:hypothetical protein AAFF_G00337410 [Aldrovandia affinis]